MYNKPTLAFFLFLSLSCAVFGFSNSAYAQEATKEADVSTEQETILDEISPQVFIAEELTELDKSIQSKKKQLRELNRQIKRSSTSAERKTELAVEIENTKQDLDVLQKSFEQVALGGINLDIFNSEQNEKSWQEELTAVVKPLLENLANITEKPRKQEYLRREISTQKLAVETASNALTSINEWLDTDYSKKFSKELKQVKTKWQRLKNEAERNQHLATYQLKSLNGESLPWYDAVLQSVNSFGKQRGLTLLLALFTSLVIYGLFYCLNLLIEARRKSKGTYVNRTTYRIIAYVQKLLTVIFILIGILVVFFLRSDVLLLAIMATVLFSIALGLRNLLPQFAYESRLLLNLGGVRENEKVMYKGIPWRVASINVFSKFINPEIQGVLRLPLSELKDLTSRAVKDEKWFPSSIGDWVLDDSNRLYEVMQQTPDAIELQSAQGTNKLIPTATYFAAGFVNLTRSKRIRIVGHFGVDYQLQSIALDEVPKKLQDEVQASLEAADIGTKDIDARVEFEKASDSSLDYIIIVLLGSTASGSYYKVERCIQQACVRTCNKEGWSIPFPQLTVHKADDS